MKPHITRAAPKLAKILFENPEVRVIMITTKKGGKIGPHSYLKGITFNLDPAKIRATETDGSSTVVKMKKGEASWTDAGESLGVENLGADFSVLSVELKD